MVGEGQMMVRWSGEVQVSVKCTSNLNLSLTLVDVKLVSLTLQTLFSPLHCFSSCDGRSVISYWSFFSE